MKREFLTGIGPVAVRQPKVRDRASEAGDERLRFTAALLGLLVRRTRSRDAVLPVLHLRGISSGDVQQALSALLGPKAPAPRLLNGKRCLAGTFC